MYIVFSQHISYKEWVLSWTSQRLCKSMTKTEVFFYFNVGKKRIFFKNNFSHDSCVPSSNVPFFSISLSLFVLIIKFNKHMLCACSVCRVSQHPVLAWKHDRSRCFFQPGNYRRKIALQVWVKVRHVWHWLGSDLHIHTSIMKQVGQLCNFVLWKNIPLFSFRFSSWTFFFCGACFVNAINNKSLLNTHTH